MSASPMSSCPLAGPDEGIRMMVGCRIWGQTSPYDSGHDGHESFVALFFSVFF